MDGDWQAWRNRVAWGLLGAVLFGLVGYVLLRFIGTITFALFVYYATRPLYRRLIRRFEHPDWVAMGTLLAFVLPLLLILGWAIVVSVQELNQFLGARGLEGYQSMLQPYVDLAALSSPRQLVESVTTSGGELDPEVRNALEGLVGPVTTSAGFVVAVLTRLFLLFAFAFYLLRDDHKIAAWFRRSFDYDSAVAFARRVDEDLETVFFGNLVTIVATGAIAVGAYMALDWLAPSDAGLAYPVLLGLLTGIGTLIPVVGMKLVYLPYTLLLVGLAATGDVPVWLPVAFLGVTFVVVDTFPDIFVRSYVSSGSLDMGLVLFAYVLGTLVFGWYGIFFGPILLVAFVHFAREIFPRIVSGDWIRA
jgi:predicted PurR-regulated permease PerM